ncbi:hypothetical protein BsWGS_11468 [Bradybaena similaris]
MASSVLLVLILGVSCIDVSRCQLDDPCQLFQVQRSYMSDLEYLGIPKSESCDLQIPNQCLSGTVNWHSPVGSLVLYTYRDNGGYQLCIEESWGFNIGQLRDLTGEQDRTLPLPTVGKASCIDDLYGQTKLLVTANSTAMISFDYQITYRY